MFDIGWSELLVIAVVAVIVVGPKDLPRMLRSIGQLVGQIRRMANEFTRQFDEALRESELHEIRDSVSDIAKVDPPSDAAAHTSKPLVYGPLEALCRPLLNSATIFHRRSRDIPLLVRYFTASASGRSLGPFSQGRWSLGLVAAMVRHPPLEGEARAPLPSSAEAREPHQARRAGVAEIARREQD